MEDTLLEVLNEMENKNFKSLNEAGKIYTNTEILDIWLNYEGIKGYTNQILSAMETLREIV